MVDIYLFCIYLQDNKSPNVTLEIPGHYDIGPGEAAGITLASLLGLLLAIGAAVLGRYTLPLHLLSDIDPSLYPINSFNSIS